MREARKLFVMIENVQQLFSQFPSGLMGLGLLLLRLELAVFLGIDGTRTLALASSAVPWPRWLLVLTAVVLIACAVGITIGFVTPVTSAIAVAIEVALAGAQWWTLDMMSADVWQTRACQIAVAFSLALIGPGAYSLDARWFGRCEITLPPRNSVRR